MAISIAWTDIAAGQVDADSPLNQLLFDSIRDDLYHLKYWIGKDYVADDNHNHDGFNTAQVTLPDGKIMLPYYMAEEATEHSTGSGSYFDYTYSCRVYIPANAANVRLAARVKGAGSGNIGLQLDIGGQTNNIDPLAVTTSYGWNTDVLVDVSSLSGWYDAVVQTRSITTEAYLQGFSLSWEN